MSYLQREWGNYNDASNKWCQLLLVTLSVTEDCLRYFSPRGEPWWLFHPIYKLRGFISQGKQRRLLKRFVKEWAKCGNMGTSYFYDYDHKRQGREGQMVVVTIEWQQEFRR